MHGWMWIHLLPSEGFRGGKEKPLLMGGSLTWNESLPGPFWMEMGFWVEIWIRGVDGVHEKRREGRGVREC